MLYSEIITQIKTEGRVLGDDNWQLTIVSLLNELFKEAVESQRPFELRTAITLPLNTAQGTVTLPTNFFLHHEVLFNDANSGRQYPLSDVDKAIAPAPRGLYGKPKGFEVINGNRLILNPFDMIVSGDAIFLIYYQIPPIILDINQPNPIPRLEPFLIRAALRRIRMFHSDDLSVAQMLTGDIASAAKGYSEDEPEKEK